MDLTGTVVQEMFGAEKCGIRLRVLKTLAQGSVKICDRKCEKGRATITLPFRSELIMCFVTPEIFS